MSQADRLALKRADDEARQASKRAMLLNVNEVFGPTVQGEGPHAGRRATFLRMAGCNLACSWCDTAYSWDWSRYERDRETHPTSPVDVAEDIARRGADLLVITGGEPMLQQPGLARLLPILRSGWGSGQVDVETNGTIVPNERLGIDLYVVSAPCSSSSSRRRTTWTRRTRSS